MRDSTLCVKGVVCHTFFPPPLWTHLPSSSPRVQTGSSSGGGGERQESPGNEAKASDASAKQRQHAEVRKASRSGDSIDMGKACGRGLCDDDAGCVMMARTSGAIRSDGV